MWKKLLYLTMAGVVILFVYNSYIKKPEEFKIPEFDEQVETDNIRYNIGNKYRIDAKNVVEKGKEEVTIFETAKAFFGGVRLKGKEASVDKYKNMILTGGIIGKSKFGIDFNTESIRYDDATKRFSSKTKFSAKQAINKLSLEGDTFDAPENFDVITLMGNVKIIYDTITVTCDKGIYDRPNKNIKLFENIKFTGKNLKTDKGTMKKIKGSATYAIYDTAAETLTAWGKFEILYDGYLIEGNNLFFERKSGNITAYDNVTVKKDDIFVKMGKMFYNGETKKMSCTENVDGTNGKYKFTANYVELDTETEDFLAREKPVMVKDKNRLEAADIFYKKSENNLYLNSDKKVKVNIMGEDFNGYTNNAIFNTESEKLYIKNDFSFFFRKDGSTYKITGKNLEYDTNSEIGKFETVNFKKTEEAGKPYQYFNDQISANMMEFDLVKEFHTFTGNVKVNYEEYILTSDKAFLDQKNEKVYTDETFNLNNIKNKMTMNGKNGTFDNITKILTVTEGTTVNKDDYNVKGDNLTFNSETENGEISGNVEIRKPKDNMVVNTPKIIYRKEKLTLKKPLKEGKNSVLFTDKVRIEEKQDLYWDKMNEFHKSENNKKNTDSEFDNKEIIFVGEVIAVRDTTTIKTRDVRYNESEKIAYFDYEGELTDDENRMNAFGKKGKYDENKKMFYVGDLNGTKIVKYKNKDNEVRYSCEQGAYDMDKEIFKMQRDVKIEIDDIITTGEQLDYYTTNGDVVSNVPLTVVQKGLKVVGKKGVINVENKNIKTNFVTVTTEEGDKLTGDYLEGDYLTKEFNFKDNLKADLSDGSSFMGRLAKIFFIEENDDYKMSRGEIKEKTKFNYKDMLLESEYMEIDNIKRFVYGKQKPKLKIIEKIEPKGITEAKIVNKEEKPKQNETETTADYIYLDVNNEIGYLERNVAVTHNNSDVSLGMMNSKSDKALLRNHEKIIELNGNVVVSQRANTIFTDKGFMNLMTNELSGDGNINFKYKIEKENKKSSKTAKQPAAAKTTGTAITTKTGITTASTINKKTEDKTVNSGGFTSPAGITSPAVNVMPD